MPPIAQGQGIIQYASFPGVVQMKHCTYTRSHGVTPGVATIEMVPQANFTAAGGTLSFFFAGKRLNFRDFKVDRQSIRMDDSGQTWNVSLFDRRWKWKFGEISGLYNQRLYSGDLDPSTIATPQQLATLCLVAMGEARYGFNVGDLPNDARPMVNWRQTNPARALADLCEQLGCRVVLQLDDTVRICRVGIGANLPVNPDIHLNSLTIKPPERPDSLRVVCGPTRFQYDFVLQPVGMDLDGTIKSINDLSYKPKGGWQAADVYTMKGVQVPAKLVGGAGIIALVGGAALLVRARALAMRSVFRWYQVSLVDRTTLKAGLIIPGYGKLTSLKQILPLESVQLSTVFDLDGRQIPKPAEVYGVYAGFPGINSAPGTLVEASYNTYAAQGIIAFAQDSPMYSYANAGAAGAVAGGIAAAVAKLQILPASLYLRAAFTIKDPTTGVPVCYERDLVYPGAKWGTGARLLPHPDLTLAFETRFNSQTGAKLGTLDNKGKVDAEADYYLAATDAEYRYNVPQEITYNGLYLINPDGAIQQVTFSAGENGCQTRACRNDEFHPLVPPYDERRKWEKQHGDPIKDALWRDEQRRLREEQHRRAEPIFV